MCKRTGRLSKCRLVLVSFALVVFRELDPGICFGSLLPCDLFSGKTFVAAELLQRRLKKVQSKRGLFLVPCRNLVDQQANAIEEWIGRNEKVDRFHGGLAPPGKGLSRILVSTPEAFIGLQSSQLVDFGWDTFSVCVFDEVHHMLKDHPYRRLALNLRNHS